MRAVLLLALLLSACTGQVWTLPVTPPQPAPIVVPVDPVQPGPVEPVAPAAVVPYAAVQTLAAGMTVDAVNVALGRPAPLVSRADDGTTAHRWAAIGPTGAPRWLIVTFTPAGLSLPHALIPRAG